MLAISNPNPQKPSSQSLLSCFPNHWLETKPLEDDGATRYQDSESLNHREKGYPANVVTRLLHEQKQSSLLSH